MQNRLPGRLLRMMPKTLPAVAACAGIRQQPLSEQPPARTGLPAIASEPSSSGSVHGALQPPASRLALGQQRVPAHARIRVGEVHDL